MSVLFWVGLVGSQTCGGGVGGNMMRKVLSEML